MTEAPTSANQPARGYVWRTFGPGETTGIETRFTEGNDVAVRHGAWSDAMVLPAARRFAAELATIAPWTASEAFAGSVRSWAYAEAQAALVRAYIEDHGHFDAEGEERPAVRTLDRIEARLQKARAGLGLDPGSLAKLMAGAAAVASATGDTGTVEQLAAEGRRILASRMTTPPTEGTDDDQ